MIKVGDIVTNGEYGYYPFLTESLILHKEKDNLVIKNLKKFSMTQ
jgi:hypothetical protein